MCSTWLSLQFVTQMYDREDPLRVLTGGNGGNAQDPSLLATAVTIPGTPGKT